MSQKNHGVRGESEDISLILLRSLDLFLSKTLDITISQGPRGMMSLYVPTSADVRLGTAEPQAGIRTEISVGDSRITVLCSGAQILRHSSGTTVKFPRPGS